MNLPAGDTGYMIHATTSSTSINSMSVYANIRIGSQYKVTISTLIYKNVEDIK